MPIDAGEVKAKFTGDSTGMEGAANKGTASVDKLTASLRAVAEAADTKLIMIDEMVKAEAAAKKATSTVSIFGNVVNTSALKGGEQFGKLTAAVSAATSAVGEMPPELQRMAAAVQTGFGAFAMGGWGIVGLTAVVALVAKIVSGMIDAAREAKAMAQAVRDAQAEKNKALVTEMNAIKSKTIEAANADRVANMKANGDDAGAARVQAEFDTRHLMSKAQMSDSPLAMTEATRAVAAYTAQMVESAVDAAKLKELQKSQEKWLAAKEDAERKHAEAAKQAAEKAVAFETAWAEALAKAPGSAPISLAQVTRNASTQRLIASDAQARMADPFASGGNTTDLISRAMQGSLDKVREDTSAVSDEMMKIVAQRDREAEAARGAWVATKAYNEALTETEARAYAATKAFNDGLVGSLTSAALGTASSLVSGGGVDLAGIGTIIGTAAGGPLGAELGGILGDSISSITSAITGTVGKLVSNNPQAEALGAVMPGIIALGAVLPALIGGMAVIGPLVGPLVGIAGPIAGVGLALLALSTTTAAFNDLSKVTNSIFGDLVAPLGAFWIATEPLAGATLQVVEAFVPLADALVALIPLTPVIDLLVAGLVGTATVISDVALFAANVLVALEVTRQVLTQVADFIVTSIQSIPLATGLVMGAMGLWGMALIELTPIVQTLASAYAWASETMLSAVATVAQFLGSFINTLEKTFHIDIKGEGAAFKIRDKAQEANDKVSKGIDSSSGQKAFNDRLRELSESVKEGANASKGTTDALKGFNRALSYIPTGVKVGGMEFNAANPTRGGLTVNIRQWFAQHASLSDEARRLAQSGALTAASRRAFDDDHQ
jgi:hypothetical protein